MIRWRRQGNREIITIRRRNTRRWRQGTRKEKSDDIFLNPKKIKIKKQKKKEWKLNTRERHPCNRRPVYSSHRKKNITSSSLRCQNKQRIFFSCLRSFIDMFFILRIYVNFRPRAVTVHRSIEFSLRESKPKTEDDQMVMRIQREIKKEGNLNKFWLKFTVRYNEWKWK